MTESKLIKKVAVEMPDVRELGRLYQRAVQKDHAPVAASAEQAVLTTGRAEAAIAEARTLAAFLDEV
jgi:hypothetical protein